VGPPLFSSIVASSLNQYSLNQNLHKFRFFFNCLNTPFSWHLVLQHHSFRLYLISAGCFSCSNGSLIVRTSTRPTRQSKVSYKDPSSSDEEQEQPPSVLPASHGQPEDSSEIQDEDMKDADDKDFTDFDVFAFTKSKAVIKRGALIENSSSSGVKCYTRLNKVQSKTEVDTSSRSESRRLRRLTTAKPKDHCSSDGDFVEASKYWRFAWFCRMKCPVIILIV
jgi:hypothetical protein